MSTAADQAVDALLADPARRPPGGWSARAEAFADANSATWREVYGVWREEQRVRVAEQDADQLAAILEGERAQRRHELARTQGGAR